MNNHQDNIRFMTREEIAFELGISTRKLYDDIRKTDKLREQILKRGLLSPYHIQLIKEHYGV
jgi:hypothetical protein